jgi:predicted methyltransferase
MALALTGLLAVTGWAEDNYQEEADRLAEVLNWQPGSVVADLGAGRGELTLPVAKRVGPTGRVYSTELDPKKLAQLEELAAKEKNVTALPASATATNLPPECCDSIFMRLVYHHLTKPAEVDASLLRTLKPGGLLAVLDEEPAPGSSMPDGVPKNRVGHGVPQQIVIDELTAAGFELVTTRDWPGAHDSYHPTYCVVFRKPRP